MKGKASHWIRLSDSFLFIDEAGDLGISKGSSRHIVFSAVRCTPMAANRFLKKCRKQFKWSSKNREIKFSKLSTPNKNLFFRMLGRMEYSALCCHAPKSALGFFSRVSDSKRREFVLQQLVSDAVNYLDKFNNVEIDSGLYKKDIREKLEQELKTKYAIKSVEHKASNSSSGLQLADMVASAVSSSLKGNAEYENQIRPLYTISLENLKIEIGKNRKIIIKSGNKIITLKK